LAEQHVAQAHVGERRQAALDGGDVGKKSSATPIGIASTSAMDLPR